MIAEDHLVSCEEFEGPLDLLLYLVRKQEVAIRDISLSRITREYLLFVKDLEEIDFDGAGEFIRYAATLLAIKAKGITQEEEPIGGEEDFETKESLIEKLTKYKKFKGIGIYLGEELNLANAMFGRPDRETEKEVHISINGLKFLLEIIKKRDPFNPPTTILFHIDHLIENLLTKLKEFGKFLFSKITSEAESEEKIGLFFALLEIVRRGKAKVFQEKPFEEIIVEKK
jgi:segregation and condensation protein A